MVKDYTLSSKSTNIKELGVLGMDSDSMILSSPIVPPTAQSGGGNVVSDFMDTQRHLYGVDMYYGLCVPKINILNSRVQFGGYIFGNNTKSFYMTPYCYGQKKVKGIWKKTADKDATFAVSKEEAMEDVKLFLLRKDESSVFAQLSEVVDSVDDMFILKAKSKEESYLVIQLLEDNVKIIGKIFSSLSYKGVMRQEVHWDITESEAKALPIYKRIALMHLPYHLQQ